MRITGPLLKVLRELLGDGAREFYGLELSRSTGLKSGTLYPLLDRLEQSDWVCSRWEDGDAGELGRPRRRFYRLTRTGVHEARQILVEYGAGALLWT